MDQGVGRRVPLGLALGALALLLAWAAADRIPSTTDIPRLLLRPEDQVSTPILTDWPDGVIQFAAEDLGKRSDPPIRKGDRIVSVAGRPYRQEKDPLVAFEAAGPHGSVPLEVVRKEADGRETTFGTTLRLRSVAEGPHRASVDALFVVLGVFMPWVCLLVGSWVAVARPRDPLAWLVLLMLLGFSQVGAVQQQTFQTWPDGLRILGALYVGAFSTTWPIWFALFGAYFAGRLDWERRRPWIPLAVVAPIALFALAGVIDEAAAATDARSLVPLGRLVARLQGAVLPSAILAISFFFLIM